MSEKKTTNAKAEAKVRTNTRPTIAPRWTSRSYPPRLRSFGWSPLAATLRNR